MKVDPVSKIVIIAIFDRQLSCFTRMRQGRLIGLLAMLQKIGCKKVNRIEF